jgi:hypothetical protein
MEVTVGNSKLLAQYTLPYEEGSRRKKKGEKWVGGGEVVGVPKHTMCFQLVGPNSHRVTGSGSTYSPVARAVLPVASAQRLCYAVLTEGVRLIKALVFEELTIWSGGATAIVVGSGSCSVSNLLCDPLCL